MSHNTGGCEQDTEINTQPELVIAAHSAQRQRGTLTVLMGAKPLRRAAWSVSRGCEAQNRSVVFSELFQARYVTDMNAVLEVGTHGNHAGLIGATGFPCQELEVLKRNRHIHMSQIRCFYLMT